MSRRDLAVAGRLVITACFAQEMSQIKALALVSVLCNFFPWFEPSCEVTEAKFSLAAVMVKEMLQRSCQGLQKASDFSNNPDVADDAFLLANRVLSYAPRLLLEDSALMAILLNSAQSGILVQHR